MAKTKTEQRKPPAPKLTGEKLRQWLEGNVPTVAVYHYAYLCVYSGANGDLEHVVRKNKRCDCILGDKCPSIEHVADYLVAGGKRAQEPPTDYWDTMPSVCPICGSKVEWDGQPRNSHGLVWRCSVNGRACYFQCLANAIIAFGKREWVIPPVVIGGVTVYAGVSMADMRAVKSDGWYYNRKCLE